MSVNQKKVLREITIAAGIGAFIGVVIAVSLADSFGVAVLTSLVTAVVVGALAGGVCCRPTEVVGVVLKTARKLRPSFSFLDALKFAYLLLARAPGGVSKFAKSHWRIAHMAMLIAVFIVSGRFTLGWLVALDPKSTELALWLSGPLFSFVLFLISVVVLMAMTERGGLVFPSWHFPIINRISVVMKNSVFCRESFTTKETSSYNFVARWTDPLAFALIPSVSLFFVPLIILIALVDSIITIVLLLASTERLAAMTGAAIGTVVGSLYYFYGFYHDFSLFLGTVVFGVIVGALLGRYIYALRCVLTYRGLPQEGWYE